MADPPTKYDLIRKGDFSCSRCVEREEEFQSLAEQHHAKIGEITVAHRAEVKKLRNQIADLEKPENATPPVDVTQPFPRQSPDTARCVVCKYYRLYTRGTGNNWTKRSEHDERFCSGKRWWRPKCPVMAHIHRYCDFCRAKWIEMP